MRSSDAEHGNLFQWQKAWNEETHDLVLQEKETHSKLLLCKAKSLVLHHNFSLSIIQHLFDTQVKK